MSTRFLGRALALAALMSLPARSAHAQCLDWHAFPQVGPELTGRTHALLSFDDGSGPALYVGGDLHLPDSSTPGAQLGVVRWDGQHFSSLGAGPGGYVFALTSFDDGSGPALFASTGTSPDYSPCQVMKWNGATWQSVSPFSNNTINCMAVFDDGTGPALYAGGWFTTFGSTPAIAVVKWDGSTWSPLGSGPTPSFAQLATMAVYDDGTGPALYVGGNFAGLVPNGSPNIERWKNGAWSSVGGGLGGSVSSLVTWDDGSGPSLFAGGGFSVGGSSVARWDGTAWHPVGTAMSNYVYRLGVVDDGNGERLFQSNSVGSPSTSVIYSWDGASWSQVQPVAAPAGCIGDYQFFVEAMVGFDDGSGSHLIAGSTSGALGVVRCIVQRHTNNGWERLGPPLQGFDGSLTALHVHDDGSGPALYAAGTGICEADGAHTGNILRRDGESWHAVGLGMNLPVTALATFHSGASSWLFAGSYALATSSHPAGASLNKWDGLQWTEIGVSYAGGTFFALQEFGGYLYIGGSFTDAHFFTPSTNLARWSPSTEYTPVGFPPSAGVNGQVNALTTFDDGHGVALYAGGSFTIAGPIAANRIGRFDGSTWTTLGSGMNSLVDALTTFDDGTGTALYAAGTFTTAGGVPASCVAKWNGTTWSALGAGLNAQVLTLEVFDDGSGPALYAGGNFTASGNVPMERIARWNGTSWSAVGGNIDSTVWSLKSFDDGTGDGAQLFAAGMFHHAGTLQSDNFAAWRGCGTTAITKFCFGDGSDGTCPCGNSGLPGRGCNNSGATGGARLNATGTTSPDTIVLHAGGELPNAPTLVFQGSTSLSQPILFGDGMRCVGGNLKRLFTTNAVGGALNVPDATQMSISARSAALGDPLLPGSVRSYQTWYRDQNLSFCPSPSGNAWNLSNAVRIVW